MKKTYIKMIGVYFISFFLVILICFLSTVSISKKQIQKRTVESIIYLNKKIAYTKTSNSFPRYQDSDDGDLRYMEMEYLLNEKKPIKSMIEMNSYLNGYMTRFLDPNYDDYTYEQYARYWHGPVFILRPLLLFFNIQTIYSFHFIILFIVSSIFVFKLFKTNKSLSFAFAICFYMFSLFLIYNCISYFYCILISLVGSLVMLKYYSSPKRKILYSYLFMFMGLFTSIFDFYTLELLTFIMPILFYLIISIENKKRISYNEIGSYLFIWIVSYVFPFLIKWFIDYCYFGKGIIIDILHRMLVESYDVDKGLRILIVLSNNFSLILPFYYVNNKIIIYTFMLLVLLDVIVFVDLKKYKSVFILLSLCFIRLFLVSVQSINLSFTTFRFLLPVGIFITYLVLKQIVNLKNKKN